MNEITNKNLYNAYRAGAHEVIKHKNQLNEINVFPVADGDTGSNLASLMHSILEEAKLEDDIGNTMKSIADAALSGARGNSGIIFAQYLSGLSVSLDHGQGLLSMNHFVEANKKAVDYAYEAIEVPTEGTMLTLIRVWYEGLLNFLNHTKDFPELLSMAYGDMETALAKTQFQLVSLRKASVVDAGAKGFVHFVNGFIKFIKGDTTVSEDVDVDLEPLDLRHVHGTFEVINHRYCTEAMLTGSSKTTKEVQSQLKVFGDSLIVAGSDRKMRIHIHANNPLEVFESLRTIGHITYQKVDDMVMQNNLVVDRKYKIALVTDSIADLPQSFVEEHQIQVVHLDILYKDDMYMDKMTINNKMAIKFVEANGERATSSQPELKRINLLFETLSSYYDDIIVLTVSKALSGTNNVFHKAAQSFHSKTNIEIIDTKQNSAAQGLLVMACANQIKEGKSREEVVAYMNTQIAKSKILVSVKHLNAMIKSGRLSTKGGKIANLVNLKPIVTLDKNGDGGLGGIAFSHKSSLNKITKKLIKLNNEIGLSSYGIVHIENPDEALVYEERLKKILGMEPVFMEEVSSIVALGAGEGAIAVGYITK